MANIDYTHLETSVRFDEKHVLKAILNQNSVKVKFKNGKVIVYDFRNAAEGIKYHRGNRQISSESDISLYSYVSNDNYHSLNNRGLHIYIGNYSYYGHIFLHNPSFPYFIYTAPSETETDEPATETIIFPPPETHEQFMERISARLLNLTRRIRALRHEEPHQNALSKNICREVPANHEEVLRYDIACNLLKRPVGWLALQLQTHQNRYNQHLAAVVKAKEAGRTPPTFGYDSERPKLETMLDKLEANLTEECLEEHFDMHDHAEWDKVQNKQRKITLCNEDSTPGEVLVDVNAFFTDGRGNIAEEHAKRTYHEISTKYWVMAKRTPHRNLVTERTVEIA